jgi:hypothetical protein
MIHYESCIIQQLLKMPHTQIPVEIYCRERQTQKYSCLNSLETLATKGSNAIIIFIKKLKGTVNSCGF